MPAKMHVLLIANDDQRVERIRNMLDNPASGAIAITAVPEVQTALGHKLENGPQVIIWDLPKNSPAAINAYFTALGEHWPHLPVIVLGDQADESISMAVLQQGAEDYLVHDHLHADMLARVVRFAVERRRFQRSMHRSQKRFEKMIAENADPMLVVDRQGTIHFANPAAERLFNYHRKHLHGSNFGFPVIEGEKTEIDVIGPEGNQRTVAEMRVAEVMWEDEPMLLTSLRDVTERKRFEEDLRQKTMDLGERVRQLDCLYAISHLMMRPGVSYEEIFQRTADLIPANWQFADIAYARVSVGRQSYVSQPFAETSCRLATPIVLGDENIGVLEVFYLAQRPESDEGPFQQEERRLINAIAEQLARCVQRRRAEEELRKYEHIVAASQELISFVDAGYVYQAVNDAFLEAHDKKRPEVVGCHVAELFGRDIFANNIKPRVDQCLAGHKVAYQEWIEYSAWGRRYIDVTMYPYVEEKGEISGASITSRDITAKLRLEARLQFQQRMEAIGTLAGGIAHEFNNALFGITGSLDLFEMSGLADEKYQKYLKRMRNNTDRMTRLTSQLLAYARGGKYQPEKLTVNEMVDLTLQLVGYTLDPESKVHTDFKGKLPLVEADRTQMQMVMSAIIQNAAEASEGPSIIRIATDQMVVDDAYCESRPGLLPGHYVSVSIQDNGKGMDRETLSRIFEPFFSTKFQGRGLGMAAAYGIVKNHGGWIGVASEPGQGTRVTIYLPALGPEQAVQRLSGADDQGRRPITVLVVEDDEVVANVCREMLEELGCGVIQALNGAEALEAARSHDGQIDLMILDIGLPDVRGDKLHQMITAIRPHIKTLVASGYAVDDLARELNFQVHDLIQKPYSMAVLSGKLNAIFNFDN